MPGSALSAITSGASRSITPTDADHSYSTSSPPSFSANSTTLPATRASSTTRRRSARASGSSSTRAPGTIGLGAISAMIRHTLHTEPELIHFTGRFSMSHRCTSVTECTSCGASGHAASKVTRTVMRVMPSGRNTTSRDHAPLKLKPDGVGVTAPSSNASSAGSVASITSTSGVPTTIPSRLGAIAIVPSTLPGLPLTDSNATCAARLLSTGVTVAAQICPGAAGTPAGGSATRKLHEPLGPGSGPPASTSGAGLPPGSEIPPPVPNGMPALPPIAAPAVPTKVPALPPPIAPVPAVGRSTVFRSLQPSAGTTAAEMSTGNAPCAVRTSTRNVRALDTRRGCCAARHSVNSRQRAFV